MRIILDVESILNNNEFLADTANTPKEDVEQHRKRQCKSVISTGY